MKPSRKMGQSIGVMRRVGVLLAGVAALVFSTLSVSVRAEDNALSKEDQVCLGCHDKAGLEKKLGNGELLSLTIPAKAYAESVHNSGCGDCHSELDVKTHPKEIAALASKREFAIKQMEACVTCHKKKVTEYEGSVHAALLREGNKMAPVCSDCHNPHAVQHKTSVEPITAVVCRKCHEKIFEAYADSAHGKARVAKGKVAPLCADCHRAHDVTAPSLGERMKDTCLACHKNAVDAHQDWLPNTERHLEAISCPACHSPAAQRRVNLRLYDGVAKQQKSEKTGVPQFEKLANAADASGQGLDGRALWSLLQGFNLEGSDSKTVLRGRLEVRSGVEAHQMTEKSKALKDCDTCHHEGAAPFQSVTVTIAGPDGRPLRHGAQKEVLNSLVSIESVGGFYAIGGTRIKLLDTLLVLVLAAGVGVPFGHMSIKLLFKKVREKRAAKTAAAMPEAGNQASPGSRPNSDDASI
jgi:predicted CXXCH cytochrome family protein